MQYKRLAFVVVASLGLACCVQPAPEPTPPPPTPTPTPPPPAPTVTQPVYDNWMDAPATAGDWYFRTVDGGSQAVFGPSRNEALFAMTCNLATRTVTLTRAGAASGDAALRIRTESGDRTLTAQASANGSTTVASVPTVDPLLAAMAFSKGRFAVGTPGLPTLYIPSWPEVTRVVEDCR